MSTNLYDTLGIQRDATDEQVRKAYKKRALQTHPDRAPPEQKTVAEEEFRKVNNAYEVLSDPAKRRAYDTTGVWPPPPPGSAGFRHHRRPHYSSRETREHHVPFPEDPFDTPWFHQSGFTDPFRLFESIFGDLHRAMSDPFFSDPWLRDRRREPHRRRGRSFFDEPLIDMGFPFDRDFEDMVNPNGGRTRVYSQVSHGAMTPDGRWVTESRMTRTVNGVTESVWKRKDTAGNEYATYTYPDGRERRTINGREKLPPQQHVPPQRIQPSPPPPPPPPIQTTSHPPPTTYTYPDGRERRTTNGREQLPPQQYVPPQRIQPSPPPPPPPPIQTTSHPPPTTYTYPDGRERRTTNGREQLPPQQYVPPQRIQPSPPPPPPPPIQTTSLPPPPPYPNISRKRDSPSSVSSRKRDSPIREHHSPIEIPPSHSGTPPPINHHYRPPPPPPASHDRAYVHETPHYKSRWWKK